MRLSELLQALGVEANGVREDVEVGGVAADSRRVRPGDVFFALPGGPTDGRRHIAEALGRGARAVITTGEVDAGGAPVVRVDAPDRLLGRAAARVAGDPSAALTLVGVTGTNGKTTTTYLLEAIWRAAGWRPGVVGTIAYRFDGANRPAPLTTPDPIALQALLAEARAAGPTPGAPAARGPLALGAERLPFESRFVGAPHLENILGAAAAAWALGTPLEAIARGLAAAEPPPGRLEQIPGPGFTVVVDYAHSPDALARVLDVLRPLARGRRITVFGCGGDRDRGKRPLMGEAAARRSDVVVLTSDNPRTEDPLRILADIEEGVRAAGMTGHVVEPDRRAAIALALGLARPGDLVLVAGKGHEDYQIVGTVKRHLDDREEVRRALGRFA